MNKIDDILENFIKEFPELKEKDNDIRKLLINMEENNPPIVVDSNFKKALKNKLEIQNYAKIKNTQNKKINIAEKGVMSFQRDAESIFEKPKFNFLKLLAPMFLGCFTLLGFFHFFGNDLLNTMKEGKSSYNSIQMKEESHNTFTQSNKLQEGIDDIQSDSGLLQGISNNKENDSINQISKLDEIAEKINLKEDLEMDKQIELKNSIVEKIKQRNAEKSVEREVKKVKIEDDFTKSLIVEMEIGESNNGDSEFDINAENIDNGNTEPISILLEGAAVTEGDSVLDTEVIDILGKESNAMKTVTEGMTISSTGGMLNSVGEGLSDNDINSKSVFEILCQEKGGKIRGDFCYYGDSICNKKDFNNAFCLQ